MNSSFNVENERNAVIEHCTAIMRDNNHMNNENDDDDGDSDSDSNKMSKSEYIG